MKRSKWKFPYASFALNKLRKKESTKQLILKTLSRNSVILPKLVGTKIRVHNGFFFKTIQISENMVGEKLGSLSLTRSRHVFGKGKK